MSDEHDRRVIIDRANRLLKQSKELRKMSDNMLKHAEDLQQESADIRKAIKKRTTRKRR